MSNAPHLTPADAPVSSAPSPGARAALHEWLARGWAAAGSAIALPAGGWSACPVAGADLTHAGALLAARALRQSPRAIAQAWSAALDAHPWVARTAVEGPGHLNIALTPAGWAAVLDDPAPFEQPPSAAPILLEFVSANPTGPLHIGHARQAVLGDTLARLLRRTGRTVGTEFYTNDAGAQIVMLTRSVALRMQEHDGVALVFERDTPEGVPPPSVGPGQALFPRDGYHGPDIVALASAARAHGLMAAPSEELTAFAVAFQRAHQRATLARLGVSFDGCASEHALHTTGQVAAVVAALRPHAYQAVRAKQETASGSSRPDRDTSSSEAPPPAPAWFLDTVRFGDTKDRVMIKADGSVPYFIPDVAYHMDKWRRGWTHALNIQGADHHGTLARVQAGVQWLGLPPQYPQVMFHTMVTVLQNGQPVRASKRAGTALPADSLIEAIGADAFRMALLDAAPDTPLTLDIDAWTAQGLRNPVHAVRYASARLGALLDAALLLPQADAFPNETPAPSGTPVSDWTPAETALAKAIAAWPDAMTRAAQAFDPVKAAHTLRALAGAVHAAYQQGPKLRDLPASGRADRVRLYRAAKAAVDEGHALLGLTIAKRLEWEAPGGEAVDPEPPPSRSLGGV